MYKLIIVDDEEEVRKGIIQKIEWSKYNFEISGEAENGREALDLIEENIPDAVITDITMPLMDGLELAAIIRESFPTVKTIILTGFDDFRFAQQAIKYGVSDYILKPVLPKDIDDLMEKLKIQIDHEIAQKEDITQLRRHYYESLPIIRDKFLTLLITGKPAKNEIEKRISFFNLHLEGRGFIVAVANIDADSINTNIYKEDDAELVKYAVLNISQEIMARHLLGEVFFHDDNLVIIAGFQDNERTAILNKSFSLLEEIRQNVEKYLKMTITIGFGSVCDSLDKLKDSYKTALSALEYRLLIGCNKVIFIDDIEPQNGNNLLFDENKERLLISSIKFGSGNDVMTAVNGLFDDIAGTSASLKEYQFYLMEIVAAIFRLSRDLQLDTSDIPGFNTNLYAEIFKLSTKIEIRDWVESICIKLMNHIACKRQNTTETLLEKAKDYIIHNYGDDELSIQKLSNHLHISACYLSMIFKKQAGETFLKYLISIRLDAARELLSNSDLKTSEIAEKIGYPDINYFSYFFKKNYGMSPREYRNKFIHKKEL